VTVGPPLRSPFAQHLSREPGAAGDPAPLRDAAQRGQLLRSVQVPDAAGVAVLPGGELHAPRLPASGRADALERRAQRVLHAARALDGFTDGAQQVWVVRGGWRLHRRKLRTGSGWAKRGDGWSTMPPSPPAA